ncbi:MAG TPA: SRPBCC domain-containing protein, partial [Chitinophagaceae bacterium]
MSSEKYMAKAQTIINATTDKVWDALINPEMIKKYMFGTTAISDWKEGSKIIWKGEWDGKSYEDKGKILQLESQRRLQYSHYSPLSG